MLEQTVSSSPTFWAVLYSWFTPTVFFLLLQLVIGTIYITSILTNANHNHKHQSHEQDPNFHQHNQLYRSPSVLQRLKSINFYAYPYRSHDVVTHTPQIHTYNPTQNDNPPPPPQQQQQQLGRSPSVLQRLKSINLYSYFPTEPLTNVFSTEKTREPEKPHVAVMEKQNEKEDEDEVEGEYENDDVLGNIRDNIGRYEDVGKGQGEGKFASLDEVFRQLQGQGGNFTRAHSDSKLDSAEVPPVKLSKKMKKSASSKSAFGHFKEEDIVESRRPATVRETKVTPPATADDDEVDAKADDFINKFKQQLKLQRLDSIMRYKDMINRGT